MELSKYNIFGKIHNSGRYFIVNVLSGQADILEPQYGQMVERGEIPDAQIFIDKGYLVDPLREKLLFEKIGAGSTGKPILYNFARKRLKNGGDIINRSNRIFSPPLLRALNEAAHKAMILH